MKVFVTGAAGFLGSHLARAWQDEGHEVHGSSREPKRLGDLPPDRRHHFALGEPFDGTPLEGCDAVVHCAHDLSPGSRATNVAGTRRLADEAASRGVEWQVYVGSYSAHPGAVGEYAETKLALEREFLERGHAVVKPGLVIGNGGLFARIMAFARTLHVVPLVDGGRGRVAIVAVEDVVEAIGAVLERRLPGVHRLYLNERISLRDLLGTALKSRGIGALQIPVPYTLAAGAVGLVSRLGLPTPIGPDSLRAFRANQDVEDPGDLDALVAQPRSAARMFRRVPEARS